MSQGNTELVLAFNKGLKLLAEGSEAEAYQVYHQAMGRACSSDNYRAILNGIKDLRNLVTERGIQLDQNSPFLELLGGQFDLMRLLAYSKNWGQELRPDIFESICIPGQRLSEEDLSKLRSMLKKKAKREVLTWEAEATSGAKEGETMKKSDLPKKTMSKKKERASEVPSDEEIRELESMEISEKIKEEVCQKVAEQMGISIKEVKELME